MLKIFANLRTTFYEDKEIQDIMNEYYQIKRNLIVSIFFLIKHNFVHPRQVVYRKAYDISRKASNCSSDTNHPTPKS